MSSQAANDHPVMISRRKIRGIGITEFIIGLYVTGLAGYHLHIAIPASRHASPKVFAYPIVTIVAGISFLVSGSLAIASSSRAVYCLGKGAAAAFIACLFALTMAIWQIFMLISVFKPCSYPSRCENELKAPHVLLVFLLVVEFIISIVHASLSRPSNETPSNRIPMSD